jgi:hypothetical protein
MIGIDKNHDEDYETMALSTLFGIRKNANDEIERRKGDSGKFLGDFVLFVRTNYESGGRRKAIGFFCQTTGFPSNTAEAIVDSWADVFEWSTKGGP